jgi:hypothetical protein
MRRFFKPALSLVIAGAVSAVAFASAARLNLTSQNVGAGNAVVQGCQGDLAIAVRYDTHFDPIAGEFVVDGATLDNVAGACPDGTLFQLVLQPLDPALEPLLLHCEKNPGPQQINPGPIQCNPGATSLPADQLGSIGAVEKNPGPIQ